MSSHNRISHDDITHEGYPSPQSHPAHLRTLSVLFGMAPAKLDNARILELDCASGNNIIPVAVQYPNSKIMGIGLLKTQTDKAKKNAENLGIRNIEFRHMQITDIDESIGKFDYIIAHNVFSRVSENTRAKILQISKRLLSPNGISYISYNTLPGWNMLRSIRDMMIYHTKGWEKSKDRVEQARAVFDFVKEGLEKSDTPYSNLLKQESSILAKQPDEYLFYNYLEDNNRQFYFYEFMEQANKNGLQYLADSNLSSMYVGNLSDAFKEKLSSISDTVRLEQYMDFVTNRRFRGTLLCHGDVAINRNLKVEDITKFHLSLNVVPEKKLEEIDINNSVESAKFFIDAPNTHTSTSSAAMKAVLYTFADYPNYPMTIDQIAEKAITKSRNLNVSDVKNELIGNAMSLVVAGHIALTSEAPKYSCNISEKPKLWRLALYQAKDSSCMRIITQRHEYIELGAFEKLAFRYMDGEHAKDQIIDKLLKHVFETKELSITKGDKVIQDVEAAKIEIRSVLNTLIENCKKLAIFETCN